MIYRKFNDKDLSLLGFGLMRLPLNEDKTINEEETAEMVKYAFDHGVNYFDTAYPYHGGMSEVVIGKILKNYPRESFYLADKYPGHQTSSTYNPKEIFEEQLQKCQVDYFDFYLLHNVTESCFDVYESEKWGIIDYFVEQKKLGRIKHLGFSSHATFEGLKQFVEKHEGVFEFCQIQMNFLDWTLQNAKEKYEYLTSKNIPIIVMEPLRGGKFWKEASDAFRWLERYENVRVILSGMSNIDQMRENVAIFHAENPLSDLDTNGLFQLADSLKNEVPCTSCHYCDGCPIGLDIPMMMHNCSEARFGGGFAVTMRLEMLPPDKLPNACIECGACVKKCPQGINIPEVMKELYGLWEKMPKWGPICKEREEAAKLARAQSK